MKRCQIYVGNDTGRCICRVVDTNAGDLFSARDWRACIRMAKVTASSVRKSNVKGAAWLNASNSHKNA